MNIIKKVLANVVQSLTRKEQMTAKKNIGLGDTVHQPPQNPYAVVTGSLVWDPDHINVYRLLEDWSYTRSWDSITKKLRVMPTPEGDPLAINIDVDELNDKKPGTFALINAILTFGKPYIRLLRNNDEVMIFEYADFHRAGGGTSSHVFRAWEPEPEPVTRLTLDQITVTSLDSINYVVWGVSL